MASKYICQLTIWGSYKCVIYRNTLSVSESLGCSSNFCLSGETHQIRFHLHDSIKSSFSMKCLHSDCWVADQNSFQEKGGKQLEVVLELIFVLWLTLPTSSSCTAFKLLPMRKWAPDEKQWPRMEGSHFSSRVRTLAGADTISSQVARTSSSCVRFHLGALLPSIILF